MNFPYRISTFFQCEEIVFITVSIFVACIVITLIKFYNEQSNCFFTESYGLSPSTSISTGMDFFNHGQNLTERQYRYEKYLLEAGEQQARSAEQMRFQTKYNLAELNSFDSNCNKSANFDPFNVTEKFVNSKLQNRKVVAFVRRNCPFSKQALNAINTFSIASEDFEVIELNNYSAWAAFQIQEVLENLTGEHSVPRVFVAGKCVGGGQDTEDALKDGRLEVFLREAKAIK